ncbi:drug resistance transporter, EmrB/QacA subfamily [Microlunatus sagamiharensis]|uniref:Drug resistance transporter, EmrB/QacA subfamily n=1 Tax=Microlunatus sagamiharensis TaxID=546874 RepID=A0A1H2MCQ5_9ACTN|nr:DHA2 family efflux MFS transporter permease subunit [Microlunatus sagamiharensis]SDU90256.1 drug resistance transporter, EmrB/QacA subfamily [Microlunatus sagamiharensis]
MDRTLRRLATALVVGAMAPLFDSTIVSVALHGLARDLDAPVATIQWVSTAYLLAVGVVVPVAGWLQHRVGGRRLWMAALVVFGLGSVLCSLAWDAPSLIAFRVVQGLGTGVMLPLLTTLLMQEAGGRDLGRLMGVVSLPTALGPVLGPVVGGLVLGAAGWRWLFWINVPFVVAGLVLAAMLLPADGRTSRPTLDVVGLLLLSPGVVGVLLGLSGAAEPGGFARTAVWAPLAAGGALLAAFVAWATRRRGAALVDVHVLRHRPLAASASLLFLTGASLYGAMLLLPLSFQELRGLDALGAGLLLVPQGVGALASRTLAGRLNDRFGPRPVALAGFAVLGLATLPFVWTGPGTPAGWLVPVLLVRGVGLGAVTIPLMAVGFVGLAREEVPHASIVTRIAMQVGGAVGVAVLAVVLQHALGGAAPVEAFHHSFAWAVGFTAVSLALSLLLPGRPRPAAPEPGRAQLEEVGA